MSKAPMRSPRRPSVGAAMRGQKKTVAVGQGALSQRQMAVPKIGSRATFVKGNPTRKPAPKPGKQQFQESTMQDSAKKVRTKVSAISFKGKPVPTSKSAVLAKRLNPYSHKAPTPPTGGKANHGLAPKTKPLNPGARRDGNYSPLS